MCLFGVAILVQAIRVQVKEGARLRNMSQQIHTQSVELRAERGNIYTEQGDLLCSTVPEFELHVDFSVIEKDTFDAYVNVLAENLSELFGDESEYYYKRELMQGFKKQYKYWAFKKHVPYHKYQELRTFPIFNKGQNRGGLIADLKPNRENPYKMLAFRTIGLWRENARTVGMEATYDSVLRGHKGSRIEHKMTGGGWMPVEGSVVEPRNGKDLVTTIDLDIQGIAEHAVKNMCEKYQLQYGTCVVMEVATGKVRAIVNLGRQDNGTYWEDFNYALMPTEPGSVFKLVTLTSLLNDKYISINDMVDVEGGVKKFGRQTMYDSHLGEHKMSIKEAFAHSSNVAHAKLAQHYYYKQPEQFVENIKKLKLHEKTGIDLAGEVAPIVKTTESKLWNKEVSLPWMATGYEVMITPLHTCMLYNAVANNGKMMRPYLISEVREYGKTIYKKKPEVMVASIGDETTVKQLQACVEEVGISGTAKSIKSPFYSIAGKTGTAQVADKGISYSDGVYQGSFVGYFPANAPRYTIAVVMRTQKHARTYYGNALAAPVFRMIADRVFAAADDWGVPTDSLEDAAPNMVLADASSGVNYNKLFKAIGKNIAVKNTRRPYSTVIDSNDNVVVREERIARGTVPDVSGMGLRDAIYLLEQRGLEIQIRGKGRVKAQSIAPGTQIKNGQQIVLELS